MSVVKSMRARSSDPMFRSLEDQTQNNADLEIETGARARSITALQRRPRPRLPLSPSLSFLLSPAALSRAVWRIIVPPRQEDFVGSVGPWPQRVHILFSTKGSKIAFSPLFCQLLGLTEDQKKTSSELFRLSTVGDVTNCFKHTTYQMKLPIYLAQKTCSSLRDVCDGRDEGWMDGWMEMTGADGLTD